MRQLAVGGLLHDIGRLSVPNAILNKPCKLTDAEFAEIRRYPGAGPDLLTELGGFPPPVLDLVESHHERLDGRGYPNAVPAGELDLTVRILTVADLHDALTADRVYREAGPAERALALLEDETGTAFDPNCVAALSTVVAGSEKEPRPAALVLEHGQRQPAVSPRPLTEKLPLKLLRPSDWRLAVLREHPIFTGHPLAVVVSA